MTAHAAVGGPVEATFKLAGAYKRTDSAAFLRTVDGHAIFLDASARTGSITLDGVAYPVSEEVPATGGRRLEVTPDPDIYPTLTGYQLGRRIEAHLPQASPELPA